MKIRYPQILILLSFTLFSTLGCKTSGIEIERGISYEFEAGHPELRISAIGIVDQEDQAVIKIASEIIYSSLINKFRDKRQFSNVELEIKVIGIDNTFNESVKREYTFESSPIKVEGESFTLIEDIIAIPGEFEIQVMVRDGHSGKESYRKAYTNIPNPLKPVINLTTVQLLGKDNEFTDQGFSPITTYDVPNRMDSLKFVFQVTNNNSKDPISVKSRLLSFKADTIAALPMNLRNRSVAPFQYRGIDLENGTEVSSNTRMLNQEGSVYIEFSYPNLSTGNYRFVVEVISDSLNINKQARDFSIKSKNYPSIVDVKEFAYPLYYIMDTKEYNKLISIDDNLKLKEEIDRFWLKNIRNKNTARSVIEMYYNRVEEANKLFSTYKEGWKTDLGMIYILFGPPWYVKDEDLNEMVWGYSYNSLDPTTNFVFFTPRAKSKYFPFENYILKRSPQLYKIYYQQIDLWLSGDILFRSL
ncbi:MAG: GWxTD domain-containing protein [Balneolaceae bacterium]